MAASAATFTVTYSKHAASRAVVERDGAYTLAESGIDQALYELRTGFDPAADGVGTASVTMGRGSYDVTVTPAYSGMGVYTLRSTASIDRYERGVEAVVAEGSITLSVFGAAGIYLQNATIDSYDSSVGTYVSQVGAGGVANANSTIGSNGDVTLSGGGTVVMGDAVPGPGGTVVGDTSCITGSTAPAKNLVRLAPYEYAPSTTSSGNHTSTATFTGGSYHFTDFKLTGSRTVTITGDVVLWVDDEFVVGGTSSIVVTSGSTLTINHGGGDFDLGGGGLVNADSDPHSVSINSSSSGDLKIHGNAAFFGDVLAPDAKLVMVGTTEYYGRALFGEIDLRGTRMHADEAFGATPTGVLEIVMLRAL